MWVKNHTEDEFYTLVNEYNREGLTYVSTKYLISRSIGAYLHRRGFCKRADPKRALPSSHEIQIQLKKFGSIDNLIRDIDNVFTPQYTGEQYYRLVGKIRRVAERILGAPVVVKNRFGGTRDQHSSRAYTKEQADEIVEYANTHTGTAVAEKYGYPINSVNTVVKRLAQVYSTVPYTTKHPRLTREDAIAKYKDFITMTRESFVERYGYAHTRSAVQSMCSLVKRYNLKKEEV